MTALVVRRGTGSSDQGGDSAVVRPPIAFVAVSLLVPALAGEVLAEAPTVALTMTAVPPVFGPLAPPPLTDVGWLVGQPAGAHNFTSHRGDKFVRILELADSNGVVRDLSGYSAVMRIRRRIRDASHIAELSTSNGCITVYGSAGLLVLKMSSEDTWQILDDGVYDLDITSPSGVVERIIEGNFHVMPSVTDVGVYG